MAYTAIKLEITNSSNHDSEFEWKFFSSEKDRTQWMEEKEAERAKWNYQTPGAISYRYYRFSEYSAEALIHTNLSELQGMKVLDLFKLLEMYQNNTL